MEVPYDLPVLGVAWSPDGRWAAAVGGGGSHGVRGFVRCLDVQSGRTLDCRWPGFGLFDVAVHPRTGWLAVAGNDTTVVLWNLLVPDALLLCPPDGVAKHKVAFATERPWLAVGEEMTEPGKLSAAYVIDLETGEEVFRHTLPERQYVTAMDFSPDGSHLLVAPIPYDCEWTDLEWWEVRTGRRRWTVRVRCDLLHGVRLVGPEGPSLESISDEHGDRWFRCRSAEDGVVTVERMVGGSLMGAVCLDRERGRLASGGSDGKIALVDLPDLTPSGQIDLPDRPTMAMAFSPDGSRLAVGSAFGHLVVVPTPTA
jgi:WD40 repeat protein